MSTGNERAPPGAKPDGARERNHGDGVANRIVPHAASRCSRPSTPTSEYLAAYRRLFGDPERSEPRSSRSSSTRSGRFDRNRLPDPETYYTSALEGLRRANGGWAIARCPFHDDRRPSLGVNLEHGGFRCHARECNAHGGDVLEFHRLRHGLTFRQAAEELGAWCRGER